MKLYRIRDKATDTFYRHRYGQYQGGDWVAEDKATVWTKPGGANGAIGALREKMPHDTFVVEIATIDPTQVHFTTGPPDTAPNPIRVLHDLFEAGGLEDHFYAVRDREGKGWEGPRMLQWGKACEEARQLLKGFKP